MRTRRAFIPLVALLMVGCQPEAEEAEEAAEEAAAEAPEVAPSPDTPEGKIQNALSAAPPKLAGAAAVMDRDGSVLREGTNGYTCLPDNPDADGNSPMCLDESWLNFIQAYLGKTEPSYERVGVAFMLVDDEPVSNSDPFATEPTPDNQWIEAMGPHLMVLVPDLEELEGISTDPENGGPFIMWKDTPYAHLMIPLAEPRMRK
ncbi:MAG: hypothetical protein ACE5HP_09260 [Gemmatimonadota bacterium]